MNKLQFEDDIYGTVESIEDKRIYIQTVDGPISLSDLEDLLGSYANQASIEIKVKK
ncbi:hypothetical protein [Bacillus solitudinis]|uniref:hypothetical protein n=1 Tax=Bacillus solitudinis TaxID=2014074 RepID=UPI0012FE782F|nr:hypothetical protein [Bacillus solitudinis]